MKILQLFGGVIRRGGEEMFVFNCLQHMDTPDGTFDCLVIEDCGNDSFKSWVESHGGNLYELKIPLHATRFCNHIYKPVKAFFAQHSYDVVHIHSSSIAALAVLAAAAHRAKTPKVIVHSHSVGQADSLEHKLFRTLAGLSMKGHADVYCACSKAAAEWKFAPRYASQAVIVKNGVDTERFRFDGEMRREIRQSLGIGEDAFVVGHVGRLCQLKNQGFLIAAFSQIAQREPNAALILLGDGEDREKLGTLAKEKGVADRVLFTGNVDNVQDYLCAMDVFAFPSEYEGLGIVAVEAQSAGLPVVASKGVPEEIGLTENVVFLPLGDAGLWAQTLERFKDIERIDNRETIRSAGYDIRSTVGQLKEIYGI